MNWFVISFIMVVNILCMDDLSTRVAMGLKSIELYPEKTHISLEQYLKTLGLQNEVRWEIGKRIFQQTVPLGINWTHVLLYFAAQAGQEQEAYTFLKYACIRSSLFVHQAGLFEAVDGQEVPLFAISLPRKRGEVLAQDKITEALKIGSACHLAQALLERERFEPYHLFVALFHKRDAFAKLMVLAQVDIDTPLKIDNSLYFFFDIAKRYECKKTIRMIQKRRFKEFAESFLDSLGDGSNYCINLIVFLIFLRCIGIF